MELFTHQLEAIAIASQHKSYVVTTGTGSGKSLAFFIPIDSLPVAVLGVYVLLPDAL